jgi:hypothetical protein
MRSRKGQEIEEAAARTLPLTHTIEGKMKK